MRVPVPLNVGDKAVIVSPSGWIDDYVVGDAVSVLEDWGLIVDVANHALERNGRFAGTVDGRLEDIQKAFDDKNVRLVLCSRGGYGVVQLLDRLRFGGIRRYPKWVIGYSDITALHAGLQRHGIASIHGPMARHMSDEGADDVSVRMLKSMVAGQRLRYEVPTKDDFYDLNRRGKASGRLFGGNLAVLCGLMGTRFFNVPRGGILVIEDIGEEPYKVDRMLRQLDLAGVFRRIGGLIVGQFVGYDEDEQMDSPLYEMISGIVEKYKFPVCFNFPIGHVKLNFPVLMGDVGTLLVEKDFSYLY
ncbi:MAG: S66 peptidase family protein [Fermentimonas sp.]|jgi:muramoyltetrapeptide carboxypeptidase